MRVFHGLDNLPRFRRPAVTVGSFDGVHRGHKTLLEATILAARERAGESIAVTFYPHPRKILKPKEKTWLLTTLDEKLCLLEATGIENTVVISFDEPFSKIESADFIEMVVVRTLSASVLVVGYDHKFGYNKGGDYGYLHETGLDQRIEVIRIPEVKVPGCKISSTEIRAAVKTGNMHRAASILGHPYLLMGELADNGRISIPDSDKLTPPAGAYPVRIKTSSSESIGCGREVMLSVLSDNDLMINAASLSAEGREICLSF